LPVQVRLARGEREDIAEIGNILVAGQDGTYVPLGQLARASHIGITPETVTLRWSGQPR
jgi:multidrug efflux pump subunit AcrB